MLCRTRVQVPPPPLIGGLDMREKVKVFKDEDLRDGLYSIKKLKLNDRIFANLLVKGGFYVTIDDIDIEVTQKAYEELKDGEQVCVASSSIYYERKGRPKLLKEL